MSRHQISIQSYVQPHPKGFKPFVVVINNTLGRQDQFSGPNCKTEHLAEKEIGRIIELIIKHFNESGKVTIIPDASPTVH